MNQNRIRSTRVITSLLGAIALATAVGIPANAAGTTTIPTAAGSTTKVTSCTWSALSAALARGSTIELDCTGAIAVLAPIVVGGGHKLTLEAPGAAVILSSQETTSSASRIFDVKSNASLSLNNLLVISSTLSGAAGSVGPSGTDGLGPKTDGGNGTSGTAGHGGTPGDPAQGGAMRIASGATVVIKDCTFNGNTVQGGQGGDGGDGGSGGPGGDGLSGGDDGGQGSAGGSGGNGADSAAGSHGGAAEGGAIYNAGNLTLIDDAFNQNRAQGGQGGQGGYGGQAGWPGEGGGGGGGSASTSADAGGPGGNGGTEGYPGRAGGAAAGGAGAAATGGAVYNAGSLKVVGGTFISDTVTGGAGLDGGLPAFGGGMVYGQAPQGAGGGGEGGMGVKTQGPGGRGGAATRGGDGATGGPGGAGGDGLGGAIYNAGNAQLCHASFTTDSAASGAGGWGSPGGGGGDGGLGGAWGPGVPQGPPGTPGNGGNGGNGSDGADSGSASGGGVYSSASLDWSQLSFSGNSVTSGVAGEAGPGGSRGPGGPAIVQGEYPAGQDGKPGRAGQPGKQGPATGSNLGEGSLTADAEGSRRAHPVRSHVRSATTPCNEVVVAPTSQNVMESGLSWPASPGPVGFVTDVRDQDFLQSCLSGCRNFVVWVKEAGGSQGIPNARVKVSVSPITGTAVINPAQGGGYVCQVAFLLNNRDGACGNPLTVTTDSSGGAEGKVYLRYFPPAIYLGDKATPPAATITATTSSCGNSCSTVNGTADVQVGPHLIYQKLAVGLSWPQKQALISWYGTGNILKDLGPIDKTFSTLSKLYAQIKTLKSLSKALSDLSKVSSLYGTWADYGMLLWFQQTFGIANDGLVHLGSVSTLVSKILSYVKDPIANQVIGWLNNKLFKVHTYTDEVLTMLRSYVFHWLKPDETNHDTQVMNVKLFEASYCKNSVCRSLAPGTGIRYNLFVTFSSKDFTQMNPFFETHNIDTAYAAPTWIPAQCALVPTNQRAKLCGGGQ